MRDRWLVSAVLFAIVLPLTAGVGGCDKPKDAGTTGGTTNPPPAVAAVPIGPPLTDEDCRAFAESVKQAVDTGNAAALNGLIDWDAIIDTSTSGIAAPENVRAAFAQGVRGALNQGTGLAGQLIEIIKKGGTYTLLRVHDVDKRKRDLFRLIMPENSGVNYHDYVLGRRPDGKIRAVDLYVFLSGELMSQTLRRSYIPAAANASRTLVDRLAGSEQEFIKQLPQIQKMITAQRNGNSAEALSIFNQFPAELKKEKTVLMVRFQAAQALNNDREYTAAIEDFRKYHPDDACVDLLSIDYYLLKKQFSEAIGCLDRVDRSLGGDSYLTVMRSGVETEAGDMDAALKDARRAVDQDPSLVDSYWNLVTVSMKAHKFDETAKALSTLKGKFNITFGDLTKIPLYADFAASPEYREWIANQKDKFQ